MENHQAFLLGIIQGLTEFIPVSSSGHLVLVPHILEWKFLASQTFIFDVLVQWGTLLAVCVYFWRDLTTIAYSFCLAITKGKPFSTGHARLGWYLIIATIPAVIVGLLYKDLIEAAFSNTKTTGLFLIITSAVLVFAELVGKRNRNLEKVTRIDALCIGCFQVAALLPGVSRSGTTIAGGMTRNLDRSSAARFSFLMSVPVMLGAGLLAIKDLFALPNADNFLMPLLIGFLASFFSGYIAIRWLISYLSKHSLYVFAGYCLLLGSLVILYG